MKKVTISHLSNAHGGWLRSLDFYKTELNILKDRLKEIAGKNTQRELSREVKKYDKELKVHDKHIDKLSRDIRHNIDSAARGAQKSKEAFIDKKLVTQHDQLEKKFEQEERHLSQLRHDFNRFASGWL